MSLSKTFLNLGVLFDDDLAFLFAAEAKRLEKFFVRRFNFNDLDPSRCRADFRFEKFDVERIKVGLRIPDIIKLPNGIQCNGIECETNKDALKKFKLN